MKKISIQYYKTKIGELILGEFEGKVCMVDYRYRKMRNAVDKRLQTGLNAEFIEEETKILKELKKQLEEYFIGERKDFNLKLITVGTKFQKKVWEELLKIPYGTTSTYLELAKKIDNEKAVRAVAGANGANCIGFIIPCHRIIETNGGLGGFAGGINIKKKLLNMEKNNSENLKLF